MRKALVVFLVLLLSLTTPCLAQVELKMDAMPNSSQVLPEYTKLWKDADAMTVAKFLFLTEREKFCVTYHPPEEYEGYMVDWSVCIFDDITDPAVQHLYVHGAFSSKGHVLLYEGHIVGILDTKREDGISNLPDGKYELLLVDDGSVGLKVVARVTFVIGEKEESV